MFALRSAVRAANPLVANRAMSSALKDRIAQLIPEKQAELKELKTKHGNVVIGDVTVDQAIGGARDVKCMLWDTSLLDAHEGIRFRGHTIPELQVTMPTYPGCDEPIPEGLLWLLLTGEIPTIEQANSVTEDLRARANLPAWVETMIRNFPKDLHPMSQLSAALLALQKDSLFLKGYQEGMKKNKYWEVTLEDSLNLLANLPKVAALIYRCTFHDGKLGATSGDLDYSANFNRMMGFNNPHFDELMRLYLTIHSDHEGGNASAHTTHLVGSTLADPYLSLSAGLNALAGPLHGRANQDVLEWIIELQHKFKERGLEVNKQTITDFAWETLNAGQVIPGYGHAVLRKTDPRYSVQRQYALKHMPDDELFKIVSTIYEVVPGVLTEHGKTKNPYPNVDSHSGVLLMHYGFTQHEYYTVLFGVSRAFGVLSQLVWDRALGLPLERPKSVTTEWMKKFVANHHKK